VAYLKDKKHFAFGENWDSYSRQIDTQHIKSATTNLVALIQLSDLSGMSVLDIGSGSGIHSLSLMMLGCKDLVAIDFDLDSVETTKRVLSRESFRGSYQVYQGDILKKIPEIEGVTFDLVYSWGVLHHTGQMMRAIENSLGFVKPGGLIALALYRKTPFCFLWNIEKALYSKFPKNLQLVFRKVYEFIFSLGLRIKRGQSLRAYKKDYFQKRGMEFSHDVHDWLGGYPYESIKSEFLIEFMKKNGFKVVNSHISKNQIGILGSGCDEFLFQRQA
jgi:ubiquinone/menaquinone biosynthesis C-methylase UbiE